MAGQFIIPEFLRGEGYDEIMARMLQELPDSIGKEENGWVCDLFSPVAIEHARVIQFVLLETIKNIIPKYSYGDILLGHGENRGIFQRSATYAKLTLQITGLPGTVIPAGFQFSTAATLEDGGILFDTLQETIIPESGRAVVEAQCETLGKKGNVAADTVILMVKPMKGIISVSNEAPAYGGFEMESEESIRQRIADFDLSQENSFVGAPADYRRWALEVDGVGNAGVIPAQDDSGTVTVILTDLNGQPADEQICCAVENHIMRPDSLYERLAPVNALLRVIPAAAKQLLISAHVTLLEDFDLDHIKDKFIKALHEYLAERKVIKYTEIGALLIRTPGVADYTNLSLNGSTGNIFIEEWEIAVVSWNSVVLVV